MNRYLPGIAIHCPKQYNVVPVGNRRKHYVTTFNQDLFLEKMSWQYTCALTALSSYIFVFISYFLKHLFQQYRPDQFVVGITMPQWKGPPDRVCSAYNAAQSSQSGKNPKWVNSVHWGSNSPPLHVYSKWLQPPFHHAVACWWHFSFYLLDFVIQLLVC